MPDDLIVNSPISSSLQQVKDDTGNASALQIASDKVVVGQTKDNLEVLGVIATPPPNAAHIQFGNQTATAGQSSASLTFAGWGVRHAGFAWTPTGSGGSLKLAFGGNNDPNNNSTKFVFNADGSLAFQGLPNLPSSGTADLVINSSGTVSTQLSSLRFKENVETLSDDFRKILALEPKAFTYKETGDRGIGYAAEEVDGLALNNLVGYDADGKPLTVNYKFIPVYLLEVLKGQQKLIDELQAEVAGLKASRQG